ncbi:MAG: APC family permease, partial [Acidilobus sp.]
MGELARRATGLKGLIYNSLAGQAPAYSIASGAALVMEYAAAAASLAMLITTIAVMAVVYAVFTLARRYPHAASFYEYAARAIGPRAGFLNGVLYNVLYSATLGLGSIAVAFGYLASQGVMALGGPLVNPAYLAPLVVLLALPPALLSVRPSIRTEVTMTTVEVGVLLTFAGLSMAANWPTLSALPLTPGGTFAATPAAVLAAIAGGLVFSITYFMGFEVSTQLAEEASDPRRDAPVGTLVATVIMGLLYVLVTYAIVVNLGYSEASISSFVSAASSGANPIYGMIGKYLGQAGKALLAVAIVLSVYSCYLATLNATARMFYGMAREGMAPRPLSETNRFRSPANALYLSTALAAVTAAGSLAAAHALGARNPITMAYNAMQYDYALDSLFYVASLVIIAASAFRVASLYGKLVSAAGAALLSVAFYYLVSGLAYLAAFAAPIVAIVVAEVL